MSLKNLLSGINHDRLSFADGGEVGKKKDKCPNCGKEECTCGKSDGGKVEGAKAPKEDKTAEKGDKELRGTESSEPETPKTESKAEGGEVKEEQITDDGNHKIDADSIIDLFLEENPELAETPVEEWPEDALQELQEVVNSENIDSPNGSLPEEEDAGGEPIEEQVTVIDKEPIEDSGMPDIRDEEESKEPTTDEPNDTQDFDILALSKLVEAGDKDEAWDMLQNMFGVRPSADKEEATPTNALDRMVASDKRLKTPSSGNALAKVLGSLRF